MNQHFEKLEELRLKAYKARLKILGISAVLGLFVGIVFLSGFMNVSGMGSFFTIFFLFFSFAIGTIIFALLDRASPHLKKFKTAYKEIIVKSCFEAIFTEVEYYPDQYIDKDIIEDMELFAIGNRFNGDDLLKAKYKNIPFTYCDIMNKNVTNTGKTTTTQTYFCGKWLIFDFNKSFNEYVRIIEKASLLGEKTGATKASKFFSQYQLEKISFESINFNQEFEVYSTSQQTAFYLITPHFMESLKKLKNETSGQIILGFKNGKLHIAVSGEKNNFEPSIIEPITDLIKEEIIIELKAVTKFVDELLLDKDLFQ